MDPLCRTLYPIRFVPQNRGSTFISTETVTGSIRHTAKTEFKPPSTIPSSEIDHQEGVVQFSTEVIAGDSGSAVIFDEDGSIVGVTSYLWTDKDTKVVTAVDFLPVFRLPDHRSYNLRSLSGLETTRLREDA